MPVKHMLAASAGEVVACLIRVPSEVVKQRAQVSASSRTFQIFSNILYTEGIQGLYRGYKSTVLREIPFSLVQFPMWESLKALWSWRQDHVVDCWQSAVCGAFAGGFAAAVTTPLDVAKTRIMLAKTFCKQVGLFLRVTDLRPRELTCFMLCSRLVPAPLAAMYSLRCTGSGGRRGCQDYLQVSSLERQPSVWEVSSFLVLMSKPAACCWNLAERAPDSGRCPMLCSQERGRRASSCSRQARRSVQQPTWCETEPAVAAQGLGGRGGPTEDLSPPPREPQRRGLGQRGDSTISPRLVRYQHQQPLP
uniref:Mitochondrial S-adenosylmethionine carrier protein n=3 Tax=Canis lupus TaxID=9612 RepID=A0A8P0P8R1_CANLF